MKRERAKTYEATVRGQKRRVTIPDRADDHGQAVESLRDAAALLRGLRLDVHFPGWDEVHGDEDSRQHVRLAVQAIAAEGVSPHDATGVSTDSLAELVQYIADILE
jgi:hypothetical protein